MFKQIIPFILFIILISSKIYAQGISTGSISGQINNQEEKPLVDANVVAIHQPSKTEYSTISRNNGRYNLPNLRIGGPYTLKISYVGYQKVVRDSIYVDLGQNRLISVEMAKKANQMQEVEVVGQKDPYEDASAGVNTNISEDDLNNLPSLNRSFKEFTRLTPQKGKGLSFAGRNKFYNNLTVDGSLLNNSFGLATLPGGQTNAQPLSLDAIQSVNVALSPYDVTQSGFTGSGINLVTRSGSNQFKGSVYSYFRSAELVGNKVDEAQLETKDFNRQQYGFRASGPIVEDELFFFVNAEITNRTEPASEFKAQRPGLSGDDVASVKASKLEKLRDFLIENYDYDPGRFEDYNYNTASEKVLLKLDWNINNQHKLSFRYNSMFSRKDRPYFDANSGDQNTLPFENSAYVQHNNLHSGIARLSSNFGGDLSNKLTLGFTALRDFREIKGEPFPSVVIGTNREDATTILGVDPFSGKNAVDQNILQLSNNLKIYEGNHTITIGTSNRLFDFNNLFVDYFHGHYQFNNVEDFYESAQNDTSTASAYQLKYSVDENEPAPTVEMRALQLGFYAQDQWQPTDHLKVTGGLRVDIPFYPVNLPENKDVEQMTFKNGRKIDVSELPDPKPLWSPRLGFSYRFGQERQFQLSGGSGIFTGRPRFVWLANQAGNTGTRFGEIFEFGPSDKPFTPNRRAHIPNNRSVPDVVEINKTSDDFKFPQVWRSSFGFDYKLPLADIIATTEFVYSEDINAVQHKDVNLNDPNSRLNNPGGVKFGPDPEDRKINDGISNAFLMSNTSKGRQFNATFGVKKPLDNGITAQAAYTFGHAKDLTSNPNSISYFAWGRNPTHRSPNNLEVSTSRYEIKNRVIGALSYTFDYAEHFETTISVVYTGRTGSRYSYVYAGDVNNDGIFINNDLMYVPEYPFEINLVPNGEEDTRSSREIWKQVDNYIEQDEYLNENRGEYVERNGPHLPWHNQFDLKIMQDFYLDANNGDQHTLQVSLDLINIGNFINSKWGIRKQVQNRSFLTFQGYNNDNEPQYSFPLKSNGEPLQETFRNSLSLESRWRAQIGIRYLFN